MGNRTTTKSGTKDIKAIWQVKLAPGEARPPSESDDNVIPTTLSPVKYNVEKIRQFLGVVFHAGTNGGEIFCQVSKGAPVGFKGTGTPHDVITDLLARSEAEMRGYFLTSPVGRQEDGQLRAMKSAFKQWSVLVLDDVGTKIPWDNIPEELTETYDIESSENNHQLGIVWEEPITCYEEAQMLIDFAVDAGITDGGGAMPCKKVRLPCGVNGKKGDAGRFRVKLEHMNGPRWTPQRFLDVIGADVDWEVVRKTAADRARKALRLGATAWAKELCYVDPQTGIVDPVLEWLYANNFVITDTNDRYYDILCPWHEHHTEKTLPTQVAGYSPLGHGDNPYKRHFNCFHAHGNTDKTPEFLLKVKDMGGPLCPVMEIAPRQVINYVYDISSDRVFDLKQKGPLMAIKTEAVNKTTKTVLMPNGSWVNPLPVWLKQDACVKVAGSVLDASTTHRIVTDNHGVLKANRFFRPEYKDTKVDMPKVQPFLDFIAFLIPDEAERAYFLEWFACKVQNPAFRGVAMVMIASSEGTGRGMLMEMIGKLFGEWNVQGLTMEYIMKQREFNDWNAKVFIHVDEVVHDPRTKRDHYNHLKTLVDPKSKLVAINSKNQPEYLAMCPTSFLFFSNNEAALQIDEESRRFYVVRNPDVPEEGAYYAKMAAYRDSNDWPQHVWNYFLATEADPDKMMEKPPITEAFMDMRDATTSNMEAVVSAAFKRWPTAIVAPALIKELLCDYEERGVSPQARGAAQMIISDRTVSLRSTGNDKVCGMRVSLKKKFARGKTEPETMVRWREETKKFIASFHAGDFKTAVDEQLIEDGFDF